MGLTVNEQKVLDLMAKRKDAVREQSKIHNIKTDAKKDIDTQYDSQIAGFQATIDNIDKKLNGKEDLDV